MGEARRSPCRPAFLAGARGSAGAVHASLRAGWRPRRAAHGRRRPRSRFRAARREAGRGVALPQPLPPSEARLRRVFAVLGPRRQRGGGAGGGRRATRRPLAEAMPGTSWRSALPRPVHPPGAAAAARTGWSDGRPAGRAGDRAACCACGCRRTRSRRPAAGRRPRRPSSRPPRRRRRTRAEATAMTRNPALDRAVCEAARARGPTGGAPCSAAPAALPRRTPASCAARRRRSCSPSTATRKRSHSPPPRCIRAGRQPGHCGHAAVAGYAAGLAAWRLAASGAGCDAVRGGLAGRRSPARRCGGAPRSGRRARISAPATRPATCPGCSAPPSSRAPSTACWRAAGSACDLRRRPGERETLGEADVEAVAATAAGHARLRAAAGRPAGPRRGRAARAALADARQGNAGARPRR